MTHSGLDPVERFLSCRDEKEREKLLGEAFDRSHPRLRSLVDLRMHALLRRRVDPSDVLQQAFLEALRRLGRYLRDPRIPFHLWLRKVTLYALRDLQRFHVDAQARSVVREVPPDRLGGPEPDSSAMAARLVANQSSPLARLLRGERKVSVERALERLDPGDREIIALRFFEELSNAEAARVLGIQEETARKRYFRALRRFKEAFGEPLEEGGEA